MISVITVIQAQPDRIEATKKILLDLAGHFVRAEFRLGRFSCLEGRGRCDGGKPKQCRRR